MTHAWCRDPSRDEAVRAAEDGRDRPLPTLEQCIERQKQTDRPCGGTDPAPSRGERGAADTCMQAERVTLEITHDGKHGPVSTWPFECGSYGESVRVVEEPESTDIRHRWDRDGERCLKCRDKDWMGGPCSTTDDEYIAALTAERDAAIREREKAVAQAAEDARAYAAESDARAQAQQELQDRCDTAHVPAESAGSGAAERLHRETWLRLERDELIIQRDEIISRVAELEAQAKSLREDAAASARLMYSANSDCIDAQAERDTLQARVAELEAASGGGEGEPVDQKPGFYAYENCVGIVAFSKHHFGEVAGCEAVPLYRAPPQPRGWLTDDERELIAGITDDDEYTEEGQNIAKGLLARSTPPKVVLPDWVSMCVSHDRQNQLRKALAAAGVAVKEVGRE